MLGSVRQMGVGAVNEAQSALADYGAVGHMGAGRIAPTAGNRQDLVIGPWAEQAPALHNVYKMPILVTRTLLPPSVPHIGIGRRTSHTLVLPGKGVQG